MSTSLRIGWETARIARAQQITLLSFEDDQPRQETGFGSLGFAVPAVRPEDDFGTDPFAIFDDAPVPLTIGDLHQGL